MLNGLGGRFESFRFGGIIGSCRPNPYGIVDSPESESNVTFCVSGDAMDDIDIISRVLLPDISVELKTIGVFGMGKVWLLDNCSTKKYIRVNRVGGQIGGLPEILTLKTE